MDGDSYNFKPIAYAHSCYIHCQGVPRQPGLVPMARSRLDIEDWIPPPAFEDLQQYKLNVKSLPFSTLSEKKHTKAVIRESKEPLLTLKDNSSYNFDDDVDEALLTFTN